MQLRDCTDKDGFQSTPPARGATIRVALYIRVSSISIHAPREGGDVDDIHLALDIGISIHAPREGGDAASSSPLRAGTKFQSTPPARGATITPKEEQQHEKNFNPRPPRGGRPTRPQRPPTGPYFNPRPPRGGRREAVSMSSKVTSFQSTPPARGATSWMRVRASVSSIISIHAPREGGDDGLPKLRQVPGHFNPRPPRGGRPFRHRAGASRPRHFNPRPPRGGRHDAIGLRPHAEGISIHAPREGGDSKDAQFYLRIFDK